MGNMQVRNIPLFEVMQEMVDAYVKAYRGDFKTDREIIENALKHSGKNPVYYVWLLRPHGTNLAYLENALARNTGAHSTLCYYYEQDITGVRPYLIKAEKTAIGIMGSICSLDYGWLYDMVLSKAPYASYAEYTYDNGMMEAAGRDKPAGLAGGSSKAVWTRAIPDEAALHAKLFDSIINEATGAKHVNTDALLETLKGE